MFEGLSSVVLPSPEFYNSLMAVPKCFRFPVSFDAEGLLDGTGYVFCTPSSTSPIHVGDMVLDTWFDVITIFNGSGEQQPDWGQPDAEGFDEWGIFQVASSGTPNVTTLKNSPNENEAGLIVRSKGNAADLNADYNQGQNWPLIIADAPLAVWVSVDGQRDGDTSTTSTAGMFYVVLQVVTPVDVEAG